MPWINRLVLFLSLLGPVSIPRHSTWDWFLTKWHWAGFCPSASVFSRQYLSTNPPYPARLLPPTLYNRGKLNIYLFIYLKAAQGAVIVRHTCHNVFHECVVNTHLSSTGRLQFVLTKKPSDLLIAKFAFGSMQHVPDRWRHLWSSCINENWMSPQQQNAAHADASARNNAYVMCLILLTCTDNMSLQTGTKSVLLFHGKSCRAVWWTGTASQATAFRTSGTVG